MQNHGQPEGAVRRFQRLAMLWRDDRAAAAIEFALLGSTFMMIVCFALELALILFTQAVLDNATRDAARLIQTKQISTASAFVSAVCDEASDVIPSCASKITYNVVTGSTFSTFTPKTSNLGNAWSAGSSSSDMMVQVGYSRGSLIPLASTFLGSTTMIITTVAFQNEPY